MRLLGVDLAAADNNTAMAVLDYRNSVWTLSEICHPCADEDIVKAVSRLPSNALAGFDCPLGWPREFGKFLADHRGEANRAIPVKVDLLRRLTDVRVPEVVERNTPTSIRLHPLSVSSDRIAVPALRMAGLERQLLGPLAPDRSGERVIVEVYPAAALALWNLPHRGYKGAKGQLIRDEILRGLSERAGARLDIANFQQKLSTNDHCLDALLCALVTVATVTGRRVSDSVPRDQDERHLAVEEGWIQLPATDLAAVLGAV